MLDDTLVNVASKSVLNPVASALNLQIRLSRLSLRFRFAHLLVYGALHVLDDAGFSFLVHSSRS